MTGPEVGPQMASGRRGGLGLSCVEFHRLQVIREKAVLAPPGGFAREEVRVACASHRYQAQRLAIHLRSTLRLVALSAMPGFGSAPLATEGWPGLVARLS